MFLNFSNVTIEIKVISDFSNFVGYLTQFSKTISMTVFTIK